MSLTAPPFPTSPLDRPHPLYDPLTGVANRDTLRHHLDTLLRAGDTPLALCVFDLTDLRTVNAVQGVDRGDDLLRRLATLLRDGIRRKDMVARLGGDEFAVVLTNADAGVTCRVIYRLLHALQDANLTVTTGVALSPVHGICAAELIRHADLARHQNPGTSDFAIWSGSAVG